MVLDCGGKKCRDAITLHPRGCVFSLRVSTVLLIATLPISLQVSLDNLVFSREDLESVKTSIYSIVRYYSRHVTVMLALVSSPKGGFPVIAVQYR